MARADVLRFQRRLDALARGDVAAALAAAGSGGGGAAGGGASAGRELALELGQAEAAAAARDPAAAAVAAARERESKRAKRRERVEGPGASSRGGGGRSNAQRTTVHVQEALRDAVAELFARMPKSRCANCGAHNPTVRKQGHTRLFRVFPTAKAVIANRMRGLELGSEPAAAAAGLGNGGGGGGADGGGGNADGAGAWMPPTVAELEREVDAAAGAAREQAAGRKRRREREERDAAALGGGDGKEGDAADAAADEGDDSDGDESGSSDEDGGGGEPEEHSADTAARKAAEAISDVSDEGGKRLGEACDARGKKRTKGKGGTAGDAAGGPLADDAASAAAAAAAARAGKRRAVSGPDDAVYARVDLRARYLPPDVVEDAVRRLCRNESALLRFVYGAELGSAAALAESAGASGPDGVRRYARASGGARAAAAEAVLRATLGAGGRGVEALAAAAAAEPGGGGLHRAFFLRALAVAPNRFRPPSVLGEQRFEHAQNVVLARVINAALSLQSSSEALRQMAGGGAAAAAAPAPPGVGDDDAPAAAATAAALAALADADAAVRASELQRFASACLRLQNEVNALIDSTTAENAEQPGIRQQLEKKEGLFRKNMMGKRVNFAARSVISPDPYIGTGEIGVPPYFAQRLSFPEPVTPWNAARLRELVVTGAEGYPGALAVEDERGRVVSLAGMPRARREAVAKTLLTGFPAPPVGLGGGAGAAGASSPAPALSLRARRAAAAAAATGAGGAAGGPAGAAGAGGSGARGKVVYRHLADGDLLLTNRQPTLHKPGMMAHTARVLRGERTIRMHYANCATFNADFDGDEINLHLPQDQYGRAEGYGVVAAARQFTVPTDGKPVRGLIQDHVVAAVLITCRDAFFGRARFSQLLWAASSAWRPGNDVSRGQPADLHLPVPAVLKPRPLWTGKQLLSAVVRAVLTASASGAGGGVGGIGGGGGGGGGIGGGSPGSASTAPPRPPAELSFSSACKVPSEYWGGDASGEGELLFHRGELLAGCFDKAQYGKHGLVHAVQELCGDHAADALLNALSRLFTHHLQWHGFTCGMDDLVLVAGAEAERARLLAGAEGAAWRASAELAHAGDARGGGGSALAAPPFDARSPRERAAAARGLASRYASNREAAGAAHDRRVTAAMHPLASDVVRACLPRGQRKPFPGNCFSLMTVSGAKGSLVNFSQIACLLGQQELEGRRVPRTATGTTLPCFSPYDGGARAGGFVGDRFLTGLRPQEYYFHCMAGREGLVDTAVKTSRSGYLQRCLVKNLEALRVAYDGTVRDDCDGSVVQFLYGEDGLDVTRVSYLRQFAFSARNAGAAAAGVSGGDPAAAALLMLGPAAAGGGAAPLAAADAAVARALAERRAALAAEAAGGNASGGGGKKGEKSKAESKKAGGGGGGGGASRLPVSARFWSSALGATSEAFSDALEAYCASNPDGLLSLREAAEEEEQQDGGKGSSGGGGKKRAKAGAAGGAAAPVAPTPAAFARLMRLKYMQCLAEPGESVGVLAAQSVGEPSTQMTLNTFHMAGRGEANVTLGIPRLREILMTAAARIKTPTMTLPLRAGLGPDDAARLAARMRRLRLAECLKGCSVAETPVARTADGGYGRAYRARLDLHAPSAYPREAGATWEALSEALRGPFCARLKAEVARAMRRAGGGGMASVPLAAGGAGDDEGGGVGGGKGEGEEDDDDDGAAERARRGRAAADAARRGADADDDDADVDDDDDDGAGARRGKGGGGGKGDGGKGGGSGAGEEDEEAEGKLRFCGGRGEAATYDDGDADDAEARRQAERESRRLRGSGEGSDDAGDDAGDDKGTDEEEEEQEEQAEEQEEEEGNKWKKKSSGREKTAGGKKAAASATAPRKKAAASSSAVSSSSSVPGLVVALDPAARRCEVSLALPLGAPKLLMLGLVERAAADTVVRCTPGVERVHVLEPAPRREGARHGDDKDDVRQRVQTEGVSFADGCWAQADLVDVDAATSNDVAAVLSAYGVEAARATLLREARAVFAAYGIGVDARHLSLLADFMTHQGGYRACNRLGIDSSASPLLKMSFETAAHFLTEAALRGEEDRLASPAARLVLGQPVRAGTGACDVLMQV